MNGRRFDAHSLPLATRPAVRDIQPANPDRKFGMNDPRGPGAIYTLTGPFAQIQFEVDDESELVLPANVGRDTQNVSLLDSVLPSMATQ
jgi:hypothetical protein